MPMKIDQIVKYWIHLSDSIMTEATIVTARGGLSEFQHMKKLFIIGRPVLLFRCLYFVDNSFSNMGLRYSWQFPWLTYWYPSPYHQAGSDPVMYIIVIRQGQRGQVSGSMGL